MFKLCRNASPTKLQTPRIRTIIDQEYDASQILDSKLPCINERMRVILKL